MKHLHLVQQIVLKKQPLIQYYARSFTVELSKDEIDVTVLADGNKKYRAGKQDFSGTVEGITILSEAKKSKLYYE